MTITRFRPSTTQMGAMFLVCSSLPNRSHRICHEHVAVGHELLQHCCLRGEWSRLVWGCCTLFRHFFRGGLIWEKDLISGRNSRKTPKTLSERFLDFPSRVRLGSPKPYNLRHLRLPAHFQNSLPLSTAGNASFFLNSLERASQIFLSFGASDEVSERVSERTSGNCERTPCIGELVTECAPQMSPSTLPEPLSECHFLFKAAGLVASNRVAP